MHKRIYTHKSAPRVHCNCAGKSKVLYGTRDEALAARNKMRVTLHTQLGARSAYQCKQGLGWHLTHWAQ